MIDYQLGEDGIATVTFNTQDNPLNILSLEDFERLNAIADEIKEIDGPPPLGLIFLSAKPDNFVVGVDIKTLAGLSSVEQSAKASKNAQKVFRRFGKFRLPTVAAINGTCMGGGLELSLNCTSRIITDDPGSHLSFPEVLIGILPGASGSQLLPRLIGLGPALTMMLTGRKVYPKKALKMGLVDQVVSPANLEMAARTYISVYKKPKADKLDALKKMIAKVSRSIIIPLAKFRLKRAGGDLFPAPFVILGLMKMSHGESLRHGLALEAEMFARLNHSAESGALKHIFFAGSDKKIPNVGEGVQVAQIGVIGAGMMGAGIAALALDKGITVRQIDTNNDALARGAAAVRKAYEYRMNKGILKPRDITSRLAKHSLTTNYVGMGHSQIAIEAVFEDLDLKRQIIANLEGEMPADAVIATNTSALSISAIIEGAQHPERIVGMHFFSPVDRIPLLEVIPSKATSPEALATAISLGQRLGKRVIVVKDSPGFFINRILTPYLSESFKLLKAGMDIDKLDAAAISFGFPIGPCQLMDEVGFDVIAKVVGILDPFMGERIQMNDAASKFVNNNRLGRKNGLGFYKYDRGGRAGVDKKVYKLITKKKSKKFDLEIVRERLLYSILNEAAHALEDGVINDPAIGDVGAVYGFGYPAQTGGPYWQIDQIGAANLIDKLTKMSDKLGPRFEPAPGLIGMATAGISYYGS